MALAGSTARLDDHDFGGVQVRLVTAALLMSPNAGWSVETLGGEVWPAGPPARWRPAIRGLVSRTRRLLVEVGLDQEAVVSRGGRYVIDIPGLHTDVWMARDELGRAREAMADENGELAGRLAGSARTVLSRPILPSIESPWVQDVRRTVAAHHLDSLLVLSQARRREGRWAAARATVDEAMALAPYREDVYREAMRVETSSGNAAAALRVYETCSRRLADDLGVDPSPPTRELFTMILRSSARQPAGRRPPPHQLRVRQEDAGGGGHLAATRRRRGNGAAPYVGLQAFTRDDVDRFFGREAATQRVLDLLEDQGTIVVVGASGSGKSSLVRAGVIPALSRGAIHDADLWHAMVLTPGTDPLRSLSTQFLRLGANAPASTPRSSTDRSAPDVLSDGDQLVRALLDEPATLHDRIDELLTSIGADARARLLLVIDQAEELVTLADRDQANALIGGVATAMRRVDTRLVTIMTLRADFYDRAAGLSGMTHLLSRSQLVVPPMTAAELEAAITGPARRDGAQVETGLVARLLADAANRPEVLPLLQHTLWKLWSQHGGSDITEAAYERLGGLRGSLAQHAEDAWATLDHPDVGRRVLLRGVTARTGEDATRRPIERTSLSGIAPPAQILETLDSLVGARLLQADRRDTETVYQLAHEALITHWPRLSEIVEQQRAHLMTALRVGTRADRWERDQRPRDLLLRGRLLDDAATLVAATDAGEADIRLSASEEALVTSSLRARDQRRASRRVERSLSRAELCLSSDPEAAVLLGLAVADDVREHDPGRKGRLHGILHRAVSSQRLVWHQDNVGVLLDVSSDGAGFITAARPSDDQSTPTVEVVSVEGDRLITFPGHAHGTLPTGAFDPDTGRVITGDASGTLRWWDPEGGVCERTVSVGHGAVRALAVAARTGLVATWSDIDRTSGCLGIVGPDGSVVRHRHLETDPSAPAPMGRVLAFDGDGTRLLAAVADNGGTLEAIQGSTGRVLATTTLSVPIDDLEWHPDDASLALGASATAQVLDADTLEQLRVTTHAGPATLTWTPDGSRVAVISVPTMVFLDRYPPPPETVGGPPVLVFTRTRGQMNAVRKVPGSNTVLMGANVHGARNDQSVQLHDVSTTGPGEVATLDCGDAVTRSRSRGLSFSPDGDVLALGRGNGELALVDTLEWEEVERWRAHEHRHGAPWPDEDGAISWSPDASTVASIGNDGTLTLHRRGHDADITARLGSPTRAWGWCGFTPDGQHVATLHDHVASVRSVDGREICRRQLDVGQTQGAADLHPDGSTMAITQTTTGSDGQRADLLLWNWQSGDLRRLQLGVEVVQSSWHPDSISWHPDGTTLALAGRHRDVHIVDPALGQVVKSLEGHSLPSTCVAHSVDGGLLASSGWDRTVRLWDLQTEDELLCLDAVTGPPGALAFHPTRPWLAVVDWSGSVRVWTTDLDELVTIAQSRVSRELTDAEWRAIHDREDPR
ncbi:MAG TPA: BTAD domain-containing putative transcriptional regulator [Nitriliruptoraceae bacterium]|nr:BTAD domain-containing putative transcriptional regulator [Nitriliruptoraceae bacterium]